MGLQGPPRHRRCQSRGGFWAAVIPKRGAFPVVTGQHAAGTIAMSAAREFPPSERSRGPPPSLSDRLIAAVTCRFGVKTGYWAGYGVVTLNQRKGYVPDDFQRRRHGRLPPPRGCSHLGDRDPHDQGTGQDLSGP